MYTVYTDGGCSHNPNGPGGCAAVIINNQTKEITEISKGFESTTNNRMEIMAVILALESISSGEITLFSDSQYVVCTMAGEYQKKKNRDLWERLERASKNKKIYPKWVRGHNGNKWNERCDALCTEEIQKVCAMESEEKDHRVSVTGAMSVEIVLPEPFASETFKGCSKAEYCQIYCVKEACAQSILRFYRQEKKRFGDYIAIKSGGIDFWSRKSIEEITSILEEKGMDKEQILLLKETIFNYFSDEKQQVNCLRWYMRGLLLNDCIRKTLVMEEVADNCISKFY